MNRPSLRAVYVISVAAELAGMHPQTLRNYERTGLLDPSRTAGGSRRYSDVDLERLRHIQELTNAGINLEGVKRILTLEAELVQMRANAEALAATLHATIEETHRHYRRDLVPVQNAVAIFVETPRPRG